MTNILFPVKKLMDEFKVEGPRKEGVQLLLTDDAQAGGTDAPPLPPADSTSVLIYKRINL